MSKAGDIEQRLRQGIDLFNSRQFFLCHEVLEAVWKEQKEPERQLTQGIIQIAVAYYHARRGNYPGAIKLMSRGIPRLKTADSSYGFSTLTEFVQEVEQDLIMIRAGQDKALLKIPQLSLSS